MFSTGIGLALIRLNEPVFKHLNRQFFLGCFGVVVEDQKDGLESETLSGFLSSSLNIELVHVILKGITKFNKIEIVDHDNESTHDFRQIVPSPDLYEKQHICRLNRIEIKDPKGWDTAKVDEKYNENVGQRLRKKSTALFDNLKAGIDIIKQGSAKSSSNADKD